MNYKEEIKKIILTDHHSKTAIRRAEELKSKHIPTKLFKYRNFDSNDRNILNLKNHDLWCASPTTFNDPYDCSLHFSLDISDIIRKTLEKTNKIFSKEDTTLIFQENEIETICNSEDPIQIVSELICKKSANKSTTTAFREKLEQLIHGPRDELEKSLRNGVHIGSLCERHDSMLMWSHYAENHTGFSIEYNFSEGNTKELWPVHYQPEIYDVSKTIFGEKRKHINDAFIIGAASVKSDEWAYEKEWRIILLHKSKNPETHLPGIYAKTPKPTAIYIGAFALEENKEKIKKISRELSIPIFQMKKERDKFRMNCYKI